MKLERTLKKNGFLIAASLVGAAVLTSVGAAPAYASDRPVLPSNQHVVGVDCEDNNPILWEIDSALDGGATQIGTATGSGSSGGCTGGIAVNPVDGYLYGIEWPDNNDPAFPDFPNGGNLIAKWDPRTGDVVGAVELSGDCNNPWMFTIVGDGSAYVTDNNAWCSLDLTTGVTTSITSSLDSDSQAAMGYNPVNDTVYMLGGNNSGTIKVFTIVPATGVQTRLADITNAASGLCFSGDTSGNNGYLQPDASMGFDSNGIAWIQSDGGDCYDEVIPWNPATGETWWSWDYYDTVGDLYSTNGEYRVGSFYIEGMAVVTDPAAPELPNTGINGAGIFGIGMLSVLVIGAGLVLARRRTA